MLHLSLDDPRWLDLVQTCSTASPFHHPAWAKLLAECYGYRPFALATADQSGALVGGVPVVEVKRPFGGRRWVSLPFTDTCPILTRDCQVPDLVPALADEVRAQGVDLLELREHLPELPALQAGATSVTHGLALGPDPDAVARNIGKMHRRNIRKAERAGVEIVRGQTSADVETFYRLHLLTRRRLGVPIQPRRYFNLLARNIVERDLGFVLTAQVDGEPAAAAVFLAWSGTLIYKYGASDQRFWEARPNNLLFWTAIRWGCENGYRVLDWGRTDLEDQGLREFKNGWGAIEEPLTYSVIAEAPQKPASGRLLTAMGAVIRRSPPWVCQAVGECFYRYAA